MRLIIIPSEKTISIDGFVLQNIQQDFSWISSEIHAIQWYDTYGHIEYTDKRPNLEITELGIYEQATEILNREIKRLDEISENLNDYDDAFINLRNQKLLESDWTQLPDSPLSEEKKQIWSIYRQELRDITLKITTTSERKELVWNSNHPSWPKSPI